MNTVTAVILAAGKGTRMKSTKAKVLQFGSQAQVVHPPELQEKISRELMQAMNLYDPAPQKKH